jgi:hypothetical protein
VDTAVKLIEVGSGINGITGSVNFTGGVNPQNSKHILAQALTILKTALDDCFDQTHDELARISMEDTFNKILDLFCMLENYVDAINTTEKYIKIQKTIKEENITECNIHFYLLLLFLISS